MRVHDDPILDVDKDDHAKIPKKKALEKLKEASEESKIAIKRCIPLRKVIQVKKRQTVPLSIQTSILEASEPSNLTGSMRMF